MSETDPLLARNNDTPPAEEQTYIIQSESADSVKPETGFKVYKRRFYIAVLYSLVASAQAWNWNTWGPIATSAKFAYGWSNGMLALLPAWGPIMYIITVLGFSWLIETKGLRLATIIGALFLVLGSGARCISQDTPLVTWMANLGQICVGITGPMVTIGSSAISATWFPPSQRTTATGFIMGVMTIGGGIPFITGPLLVADPDVNNTLYVNSTELAHVIRGDIQILMFVEFGWAALIFLLVLIYFPAKPPTPPSLSIATRDVDFKQGLKAILRKRNFWFLSIPYAAAYGIMSGWLGTLDINLENFGINQEEAGLYGIFGCLAGLFASILLTRVVDVLKGRTRIVLILLFLTATSGTLLFALSCASIIPFNRPTLYIGRISSSACFSAMVPLVFETLCETCYPVPESVTNAVLTNQKNFWVLVFLASLWIPGIGTAWMNWAVVGAAALCVPLVFFFKETHMRLDIDYNESENRSVNA